jgi:DNA-binding MarR family transcriptional regulator
MPAIRDDDGHDVSLSRVITALEAVDKGLLEGLALALSEEDVSVEQWRILDLIRRLGSPTMGELATWSNMPNASLSRVIDALEDAASVFRLPSPADRRRVTVQLSDHGSARLSRMNSVVHAWETSTGAWLGADTLAALAFAVQLAEERLNQHDQQRKQSA